MKIRRFKHRARRPRMIKWAEYVRICCADLAPVASPAYGVRIFAPEPIRVTIPLTMRSAADVERWFSALK